MPHVRARRLVSLLAALTALVLAGCAGISTTPAAHALGVQDRVGAFTPPTQVLVRPAASQSPCSRPGFTVSAAEVASGFCVAAEALPEALTVGRNAETGVPVYQGVSKGENVYVGITNNLARRGAQHGDRFVISPMTTAPVTRGEARAIEQAVIVRNPGYQNAINSISPNHPWYDQAVYWGNQWLKSNGY